MNPGIVIIISLLYLALLFGIAIYANKLSKAGRSIVNNPYVYSLSLAVYCTVWTFYGSIGKAAGSGMGFVAVYLGPTVMAPIWYILMRKIILISKQLRVTSISDFIASRYGKSTMLGIITTLILIFGIIPYISIQLKAIDHSFEIMTSQANGDSFWNASAFYRDKINYFTVLLAVFTILFGTRSLDPNERHEGLIAAIAFESLVKLVAFLAAGITIVYFMYDGLQDIFAQGLQHVSASHLMTMDSAPSAASNWFWVLVLSAISVLFLPRQFHVSVVENHNITFLRKASWLFPLYMMLICFFVLPIAIAGILSLPAKSEPDMFILSLPLAHDFHWLALLVFIGGFSAAASMVVVAVISLSIMVSNHLVMPFLLSAQASGNQRFVFLSDRLLFIRRLVIVVLIFLAYVFYKAVSNNFPLVSIGLISFAAILQLAPAAIGGLFWAKANEKGAAAGMIAGFFVWMVSLPIPTLAQSGILSESIISDGYFSISWLKPFALFGIQGVDQISNACIWSMFFNIGLYVVVSIFTTQTVEEMAQADLYINIEKYSKSPDIEVIKREASVQKLKHLLVRHLGSNKARQLLKAFDGKYSDKNDDFASQEFINYIEKSLTGSFGSASAKLLLSTDIRSENITLEQLRELLNQTKEILEYSQALEGKTEELTQATLELAEANAQLKHLDVLKAEFVSTVTHELRTPITTIRSFSQMMAQKPDIDQPTKLEFFGIILNECDRIKRLIDQVLDVEKLENAKSLPDGASDINLAIHTAIKRLQPQLAAKGVDLTFNGADDEMLVMLNEDKMLQVVLNLLSNALKFCDNELGIIKIDLSQNLIQRTISFTIYNNGKHIPTDYQNKIFEKFVQVKDGNLAKPEGSGLGLYITKKFVEGAGGKVSFSSSKELGTTFQLVFPTCDEEKLAHQIPISI